MQCNRENASRHLFLQKCQKMCTNISFHIMLGTIYLVGRLTHWWLRSRTLWAETKLCWVFSPHQEVMSNDQSTASFHTQALSTIIIHKLVHIENSFTSNWSCLECSISLHIPGQKRKWAVIVSPPDQRIPLRVKGGGALIFGNLWL